MDALSAILYSTEKLYKSESKWAEWKYNLYSNTEWKYKVYSHIQYILNLKQFISFSLEHNT